MTPLHHVGDFLRQLLLAIPLPVVRALFLALPIALCIWVLLLPREAVQPPAGEGHGHRRANLRFWALAALLIQVVIYAIF